jgi:hypothetical protein
MPWKKHSFGRDEEFYLWEPRQLICRNINRRKWRKWLRWLPWK